MSVALMLQPSGFVATSSRRQRAVRGLRLRREAVDSEGRYLPDGLTEEQWAEIRLKEIRERQSKDLGAWGPRFKKQKAPFWADKNLWGAVPSLPFSNGATAAVSSVEAAKGARTWLLRSLGSDDFEAFSLPARVSLKLLRIELLLLYATVVAAAVVAAPQSRALLASGVSAAWQQHRTIALTAPALAARVAIALFFAIRIRTDKDEGWCHLPPPPSPPPLLFVLVKVPDSWRRRTALVAPSSASTSQRPLLFDEQLRLDIWNAPVQFKQFEVYS